MPTVIDDCGPHTLEPILRRCLLAIPQFQIPQPPFDPESGESLRELELSVTKHFTPEELRAICANEVRAMALMQWGLYTLLGKPFIVQYHSPRVAWRGMQPPTFQITEEGTGRIGLRWYWVVQFCAPAASGNVYLEKMQSG